MSIATFERLPWDEIAVRFPYDPEVVQQIKLIRGRAWHPDERYWTIPAESERYAAKLLRQLGLEVEVLDEDEEYDDWVEAVFANCPPQNARALYIGLSKAFHPDQGGDNEIMRRINEAYHGGRLA